MKNLQLTLLAFLAVLTFIPSCQKEPQNPENELTALDETLIDNRNAVVIPAGSHNALAAALQSASTVVLATGVHTEDFPVVVTGYKKIIGQPGAILRFPTIPNLATTETLSIALHLNDASNSLIQQVEIQSATPIGGTAILIQNSQKVTVQRCKISGYQFGIIVEKSPRTYLRRNVIETSTAWQTGEIFEGHGIIVANGEGAQVEDNEISGALFGCWACDKNGVYRRNYTHDNYIGLILCKVPPASYLLPDGTSISAQYSGTNWSVRNNVSNNNFTTGYLVIDGSNNNFLTNNDAANNGTYDYEIVGDSYRFGFLTPFTFDNTLHAKDGQTVKDCGVNSTVTGGVWVDTTVDGCN